MTPQPAKPRVLIVDDNAANRMAFESLLEKGYTVTTVESGKQALEMAKREEFAVILLDVRMPEMDGFETAEQLRRHWTTQNTPIIFTSAYDQHLAQIKKGFVAGATDFLFSPVDGELLLFKVSTYVSLYLRAEAARLQIQHLRSLIESLVREIARPGASAETLKIKILELDAALETLQRRMSTSVA